MSVLVTVYCYEKTPGPRQFIEESIGMCLPFQWVESVGTGRHDNGAGAESLYLKLVDKIYCILSTRQRQTEKEIH